MPDPRDTPMACQNRQDVASRALLESVRSKQLACLDVWTPGNAVMWKKQGRIRSRDWELAAKVGTLFRQSRWWCATQKKQRKKDSGWDE